MMLLRNVRHSNVVLRNVAVLQGLHSKAAHTTTTDSEVFEVDDEKLKPIPRFEPVPEEGKLTFLLPDLSEREETFLKQQVRIILRPDCLRQHVNMSGWSFCHL